MTLDEFSGEYLPLMRLVAWVFVALVSGVAAAIAWAGLIWLQAQDIEPMST